MATIKETVQYVIFHTSKEDGFWYFQEPMDSEKKAREWIEEMQKINPDRTYELHKRETKEQIIEEFPAKNREQKIDT